MTEEQLKRTGLQFMEEELVDLKNEVSYCNHEITGITEHINLWRDTLKEAYKKLYIAEEKYEKKLVELKEARKMIKC